MGKGLIILALCALLSGCASARSGSLCTAGPILPDKGAVDRWTDSEKDQVLALNKSGVEICGWGAPS